MNGDARAWAPAVKVCGLTRRDDAETAVDAGAAYLGAILAPGYRRTVTADAAGVIFRSLQATPVGVFVDAGEDEILAAARTAGIRVVQLHGNETPELADRVRSAGYQAWKAVRVRHADDVAAALARYAGAVDALLLDGYDPSAAGGTGTRFDWAAVAARLGALPDGLRLIAAGGLRPDNVAEAVRTLRPHAVDVSSGVEQAPGVKDPASVRAFVRAVRDSSFVDP
ncbi:phosphoribosylanthranilate isomerase [Longimicrobium sp.]|uniref:phosphoribosylanthranilate isomerase n=1 Tax=Longimicrobium sp. TaxID=2029185 RepID=UPI002E2FA8B6|nr:phosphoribosylanthranilate isomerase [Longimicrobium sp.]HEX6041708.1 phosphoribosylanthranilate isomerase [Longimicrobium sp.]